MTEFHAFEGLHVVEYDNGERLLHNLSKKKFRRVAKTDGDDNSSKKAKTGDDEGDERTSNASADPESDDDEETLPAPSHAPHVDLASAPVVATGSSVMTLAGAPTVDPESGLVGKGRVYVDGDVVYEAGLAEVSKKVG